MSTTDSFTEESVHVATIGPVTGGALGVVAGGGAGVVTGSVGAAPQAATHKTAVTVKLHARTIPPPRQRQGVRRANASIR
jgi:hypothetical protein